MFHKINVTVTVFKSDKMNKILQIIIYIGSNFNRRNIEYPEHAKHESPINGV